MLLHISRIILFLYLLVQISSFNHHFILRKPGRSLFPPSTLTSTSLRLNPVPPPPPPPPPSRDEPNWFEPEPDGIDELKDVFIDAAQVRYYRRWRLGGALPIHERRRRQRWRTMRRKLCVFDCNVFANVRFVVSNPAHFAHRSAVNEISSRRFPP